MQAKVLVTCPPMLGMMDTLKPQMEKRNWHIHCPQVTQILSEQELIQLLPKFDGWIIGDDPATAKVFEAGKNGQLKAAVKWGVGVDNVDFKAAKTFGIPITNTPGMFGHEVADIAFGYVIALARETFYIDREVRKGAWPKPRGISLKDKIMGLIGFGDIGRHVAKRALASEMKIIAYDPAFQPQNNLSEVQNAKWPQRVPECDFLVFTCALTPQNRHMFDANVLSKCKAHVRIVNVARGPLLDTKVLLSGLQSQHIHSAALDVMEVEPLESNSTLRDFNKCIFGSHNASNTQEAVLNTSYRAIDLLAGYFKETLA